MKFNIRIFLSLFCLIAFVFATSAQNSDSINLLLLDRISEGDYEAAKDLVLNQNANANFIDTIEIVTGGSSPSFRPPQGGGFMGALVSILVLPFVAIGAAIGSMLSSNRGSYYEIYTVLDKTISARYRPGKYEFIEFLIQNGANVNQDGWGSDYPLNTAIEIGDTAIVGLLLDYGADVNLASSKYSVMEQAINTNNEDVAIQFLGIGLNPNEVVKGSTVINNAVGRGMIEFVTKAAEGGHSLSKQEGTTNGPYMIALKNSDENMVAFIRSQGDISLSEVSGKFGNVFTSIAHKDDITMYDELEILAKAFPHLIDESTDFFISALDEAVDYKNYEYALWLIEKDAFVSEETRKRILGSNSLNIIKAIANSPEEKLLVSSMEFDRLIRIEEFSEIEEYMLLGVQPKPKHLAIAYNSRNVEAMRSMLKNEQLKIELFGNDSLDINIWKALSPESSEAFHLLLASGVSPETESLVKQALEYRSFKYLRVLIDYGCNIHNFSDEWDYRHSGLNDYFNDYTKEYYTRPRFYPAYSDGTYHFVNASGEQVFDKTFEAVLPFQLNRAVVKENGSWFLLNLTGEIITEAYDSISYFQYNFANHDAGLAMVTKNGKYNFIDRNGVLIFDIWFDESVPFDNVYTEGIQMITSYSIKGNYGIIRDDGAFMSLPKYQKISSIYFNYYGANAFAISKKGKEKELDLKEVNEVKLNKFVSKLNK